MFSWKFRGFSWSSLHEKGSNLIYFNQNFFWEKPSFSKNFVDFFPQFFCCWKSSNFYSLFFSLAGWEMQNLDSVCWLSEKWIVQIGKGGSKALIFSSWKFLEIFRIPWKLSIFIHVMYQQEIGWSIFGFSPFRNTLKKLELHRLVFMNSASLFLDIFLFEKAIL